VTKPATLLAVVVAAGIAGGVYFALSGVAQADDHWIAAAAGSVLLIPLSAQLPTGTRDVRMLRAAQVFFLPLLYPFSFVVATETWTWIAIAGVLVAVRRWMPRWTALATLGALAVAYLYRPRADEIELANMWALLVVGWAVFLPLLLRQRAEAWRLLLQPRVALIAVAGLIAFVATVHTPLLLRIPLYVPALWFALWVALNARTPRLLAISGMACGCALLQPSFDLRIGVPFYALFVLWRSERPIRHEVAFLAFEAALGAALLIGIEYVAS
jgi:hypothetical protein